MPVMEGKAMLFKEFAGVDAFPLCLDTTDVDEIVAIVPAAAPTFGAINLEDIAAPRCFEIERRLREELDIPVFHDDQHGTAIVVLAALLNALRVVRKRVEDARIVIRVPAPPGRRARTSSSPRAPRTSSCATARERCTAVVPSSTPSAQHSPIAPTPGAKRAWPGATRGCRYLHRTVGARCRLAGRRPHDGLRSGRVCHGQPYARSAARGRHRPRAVMATGRSDYPNQINNVLAFPGVFRGALDVRATTINEEMKLAAARAIAAVVSDDELDAEYIIPSAFNRDVAPAVAEKVAKAAESRGVARRHGPVSIEGMTMTGHSPA